MSRSERGAFWPALLLIAAVTVAVYAVSLGNGFVSDDDFIIVKNPQTLSFQSVPTVLFTPDVVRPYYRPLNRASYLLDYRLFGMNPAGFHAVNVLIHLGTAVLLYLLARRLLSTRWAAAFAALLFAVHPANTEAVNFVSARNTLLAAFFSLASLLSVLRVRERGGRWPVLASALFFCGLLSKETGLMLVGVLAAVLFVPLGPGEPDLREPRRTRLVCLLPFVAATALYLAMRTYSLQGVVAAQPGEIGLLPRLALNLSILPQYLGLLLVPLDLTLFHEAVPSTGLLALPGVIPAIWLGAVAVLWLLVTRGNRATRFGLLWLAVNYVPIANLVPIPSEPMTERFLYLPAVGFFLMAGAGFEWLASRERFLRPAVAAAAIAVAGCGALSVQRNLEWRDDLSLFASGVENDPRSVGAHFNLGTVLKDKGDLGAARREWERALELDPKHADTLAQMGTLAAIGGDLGQAERYYRAALDAPIGKSDPDKAMAHYNLGKVYEKQGRTALALQHYEQFLRVVSAYYREYEPEVEQRVARLRRVLSPADASGATSSGRP